MTTARRRWSGRALAPLVAVASVCAIGVARTDTPPAATRTTADGVFSSVQAARGQALYMAHCARTCHLAQMTGGERVPAIAGEGFMQRWRGQRLLDLFNRIRLTMPQDRPGVLPAENCVDVVAFILDSNGMPSGQVELPPDEGVLVTIEIRD